MWNASRPHSTNRLASIMPRPYSAARVRKKTASSGSHWSTLKWTPYTTLPTTSTTAARRQLASSPPTAIPKSTLIMSIGAVK